MPFSGRASAAAIAPRSSSFCALPSPLRAEGNDDTDTKQRFFGRAKVSLPKGRKVRFSAATAEPPARLEFATNHQPNYAQVRSMGYTSLARSAGRRQQARHAEHGPKNWGFSQPRYFLFGAAELSQKPVRAFQRAPKRGHFFSCLAAALKSPQTPRAGGRTHTHTKRNLGGAASAGRRLRHSRANLCALGKAARRAKGPARGQQRATKARRISGAARRKTLVMPIYMRRSRHKHSTCGLVAMASA